MKKRAEVAILTSEKMDFKTKPIIKDKEGHYTMIEEQSNKRINPRKHFCTQHRGTRICKTGLYGHKGRD